MMKNWQDREREHNRIRASRIMVKRDLLESLVDNDDCWLDHHGGCQAHMYLNLAPGEICPQAELKTILEQN